MCVSLGLNSCGSQQDRNFHLQTRLQFWHSTASTRRMRSAPSTMAKCIMGEQFTAVEFLIMTTIAFLLINFYSPSTLWCNMVFLFSNGTKVISHLWVSSYVIFFLTFYRTLIFFLLSSVDTFLNHSPIFFSSCFHVSLGKESISFKPMFELIRNNTQYVNL